MSEAPHTCSVVSPVKPQGCTDAALYVVQFKDGDRAYACQDCAIAMRALADSMGAGHTLKIIPLHPRRKT